MSSKRPADLDKRIERERYDGRAMSRRIALDQMEVGAAGVPDVLREPYIAYERLIGQRVSRGSLVCELGAGIGMHSKTALESGVELIAVDISAASLELLASRYSTFGERVHVVSCDIEALPFLNGSLDAVVSAGALSYGDPKLVCTEIARVLRVGGLFICVDSLNDNPIYRFNRWLHYLRSERTASTLKFMPSLRTLRQIDDRLRIEELSFFGACTWGLPLLRPLLGDARAARTLTMVDRLLGVRRSAFKFVLVARRVAEPAVGSCLPMDRDSRSGPSDAAARGQPRVHLVRFAQGRLPGDEQVDPAGIGLRSIATLPTYLSVSCVHPLRLILFGELDWRGSVLLGWFALNNVTRRNAFVIVVRDPTNQLVHRSTVVRRDLRKAYRGGGYEITQVWTHPRFRGQHIASRVLRSIIEASPGVEFHWVSRQRNAASIAVAKGSGFVPVGLPSTAGRVTTTECRRDDATKS